MACLKAPFLMLIVGFQTENVKRVLVKSGFRRLTILRVNRWLIVWLRCVIQNGKQKTASRNDIKHNAYSLSRALGKLTNFTHSLFRWSQGWIANAMHECWKIIITKNNTFRPQNADLYMQWNVRWVVMRVCYLKLK